MNRAISTTLLTAALIVGGCEPANDATDSNLDTNSNNSTTTPREGETPARNSPDTNRNNAGAPPTPVATPPANSPTNPTAPSTPATAAAATDAQILSILLLKDNEEAAIGRLAQNKATSDTAKELADMLVNDHTDHADKVRSTATSASITLMDDAAAKRELDRLRGTTSASPDALSVLQPLTGAEFDRRFGELMAQGHQDLIRVLETAQARLTNQEVRTLVEETLPVLRHHQEMAEQISAGAPTP